MQKGTFESRLSSLKKNLKAQKIDFFILPNSDEFFSEYLPEGEKRLQYLTNFTGSNACVIVGSEKSYFFTDGRYILQARNELNLEEFTIINMADESVLNWLNNNVVNGQKVALDPKLSNVNFIKYVKNNCADVLLLKSNPVDEIWDGQPKAENSDIFFCTENLTGANSTKKRHIVLKDLDVDALVITKPENICWLLNARAADVECTPLLLSYAILFKNGEVDLFVDGKRIKDLSNENLANVNLKSAVEFEASVLQLKALKKIQFDAASTNYWLYDLLQFDELEVSLKADPIDLLKACKNEAEIKSAIKTHEVDGIAVTKFLVWLDKAIKNNDEIDEIKAANKLLEFRKENDHFLYPSFGSISSFAGNGAIIHYQVSEKTNKKFEGNSLYLIDSGGQYFGKDFFGTTDVTRTIAIGSPSQEMIEDFTLVLKGHIALARAKFPIGTTGAQLDALARSHLWAAGKNYDHGTGHGVGSFLSVHEGPCGISKRSHQPLIPGMILSNEPGFYKEGEYGIRIESLMLVEEIDDHFLQFRTLTLVPIDLKLVDSGMLNEVEKKWLDDYQLRVDGSLV